MTVGGLWEVLFATVRGHEVNEGFLVTGMLFPLTLPPTIPLWQVATRHLVRRGDRQGNLSAALARTSSIRRLLRGHSLYFAYASEISSETNRWGRRRLGSRRRNYRARRRSVPIAAAIEPAPRPRRSTALTKLELDGTASWGFTQGSMGETSTAGLRCSGAVILIAVGRGLVADHGWLRRRARWAWARCCGLPSADSANPMMYLNAVRGTIWSSAASPSAAVFMATDPVSAAMTDTGRWIYGVLIGVMTDPRTDDQPCIPRRDHVGNSLRQRHGSADRLLRDSSQHQAKDGPLCGVTRLLEQCWWR